MLYNEKNIDGVDYKVPVGMATAIMRHLEVASSDENEAKAMELLFEATAQREIDYLEAEIHGLPIYLVAFYEMGYIMNSLRNEFPHPWQLDYYEDVLREHGFSVGIERVYADDEEYMIAQVIDTKADGDVIGTAPVYRDTSEGETMLQAINEQKLLVLKLIAKGYLPGVQL